MAKQQLTGFDPVHVVAFFNKPGNHGGLRSSSPVLMAASETAATITVLPARQESQPAPLQVLNYDSCRSHLLAHHLHDQSCAATVSTLPFSTNINFEAR